MRMVFPKQTPSQFLDDLATDMNSLVETIFGEETRQPGVNRPTMRVPLDIDESDDAFFVTLDVPGVAQEAIEIDVHEDTLTVKGSRGLTGDAVQPQVGAAPPVSDAETDQHVQATEDSVATEPATATRKTRQRERVRGAFRRVVRFSVPIESESVSAELTDGVLVIAVPKADPNKGKRRIPVSKA